jgi:PAS domain S-box-containing protein
MTAPPTRLRRDDPFPLLGYGFAFAIIGGVLGFGVTLAAWLVDTWWQGVGFTITGVWRVHGSNPLHVFLDVAPIAGAALGYLLGAARSGQAWLLRRAEAVEDARRKDQSWRRVAAASPDGLFLVDGTGVVQTCNPAAERILGLRAAEIVGQRIDLFLHDVRRMKPENAFDLRTGLGQHLGTAWKLLARHGTGAVVPVVVTVSNLGKEDDALRVFRVRDVSLEPKRPDDRPEGPQSV